MLWQDGWVMVGKSKVIQVPVQGVACVIVTALALLEPVAAALGVAVLIKWLGWQQFSVPFWIVLSPALYAVWLLILLSIYTAETTGLGRFFEKPRRLDTQRDKLLSFSSIVLILLYRRAFLVGSLPMILHFAQVPVYAWLIPRSYSTKLLLGDRAITLGTISDPDITSIGAGSILGHESRLIAHSFTRNESGALVYQSALIEIGKNVTVGGGAQIEMGAKIGDGTLIEPCSHVTAHMRIPAGEVWGGNPASFKRKREVGNQESPSKVSSNKGATDNGELTGLVADALSLPRKAITSSASSAEFSEWDSIGMMAIAAALHDRFGIVVPAEDVFRLNSVAGIEKYIKRDRDKGEASVIGVKFLLPENPELFPIYDPGVITMALARREQGAKERETGACKVRVVIAATFTAEPLAFTLKLWGKSFGFAIEVEFHGFNQVQQALLSSESPFLKNKEGMNVVLIRSEDLINESDPQGREKGAELIRAIQQHASLCDTPLLVGDLPPIVSKAFAGGIDESEQLRTWWRESLRGIEHVEVLPFSEIITEVGTVAARDEQMERIASAPYSAVVYQRLGIAITRAVRQLRVSPRKVIALDCDGTLWDGVVGEDGVAGIRIERFRQFQSQLLALKGRGVLLVLVSKNSAEDIWNVLDKHEGMVLRRKDIAAARINWEPKSKNLRELARELNVGLDTFAFFDDNPVERLEVESNCPEVTVVPLPSDTASFGETLSKLWLFDSPRITAEDQARSRYMHQESERKKVQAEAVDLQSYLKSLELKVEMRLAEEADIPRVAQLTQKTNQFNLSLKRRTEQEIRELKAQGSLIWVVSARDRFGDYGLVGTCIANIQNQGLALDTLLMSCRALGRGVEDALLYGLAQKVIECGKGLMLAEYVSGPRNEPVKKFLLKSGFIERKGGSFELNLANPVPLPEHVDLKLD
jgi:FkbH-like protein